MRSIYPYGIKNADFYDSYYSPTENLAEVFEPLIGKIKEYDDLRLILENKGGTLNDLKDITNILNGEFRIKLKHREVTLSLADRRKVNQVLRGIYCSDIRLDVRRLDTSMPVYYLCRIVNDYWTVYGTIVEDFYMSPGYPIHDIRFSKLMVGGHDSFFMRLSQFRKQLLKIAKKEDSDNVNAVTDDILYKIGLNIFDAAWHDDQRVGFAIAEQFNLPNFKFIIEALYLCLSGDLCQIRNETNPQILQFFESVYYQPLIRKILETLPYIEGAKLTGIHQKALKLYIRLSKSFRRFLKHKVVWLDQQASVQIWKLIFANFGRLHLVAQELNENPVVTEISQQLENDSRQVAISLLGHTI